MANGSAAIKEEYKKYTFRRVVLIVALILIAFSLFWVSLCVGTRSLSVSEVFGYFIDRLTGVVYELGTVERFDSDIVWNYRVPRAAFAIIAGVSLAIAGCVMQSVMKNPLADPYTTGVSSGALFGVCLAMIFGLQVGSGGIQGLGVIINALIFAMVPVLVMIALAPYFKNSPASLILAGVATSYLFNSMTTLFLVSTDAGTLHMIYTWQIGTLSDLSWDAIPLTFFTTCIGIAILLPLASKLNLMAMSDKEARALGLDVEKLRMVCLMLISLMVATIISYVGIIGFVGLVIPHMVRLVIGSDNKYVMPAAAAFGAVFLLGCDIISRAVDLQAAVPVGVITSFIGAPIFLYLIIRNKNTGW